MMLARVQLVLLIWATLPLQAHVAPQFYAEWEESGDSWQLVVQFDAGYADPATRDDLEEPPPTRDWLLAQSPVQWEQLRQEAKRYLHEMLQVRIAGERVGSTLAFPDWEQSPPDFPSLLNGIAYFRIRISGRGAEEVAVGLAEGDFPKLVVAKGEEELLLLAPGEFEVLRAGRTGNPGGSPQPLDRFPYKWWLLGLALLVVIIFLVKGVMPFLRQSRS